MARGIEDGFRWSASKRLQSFPHHFEEDLIPSLLLLARIA